MSAVSGQQSAVSLPLKHGCNMLKRQGGEMKQSIVHVALVVRDYDEAIDFYCQKLHFRLVEDT